MKDFNKYLKKKNVIKDDLNVINTKIFCNLFNNDTFDFSI